METNIHFLSYLAISSCLGIGIQNNQMGPHLVNVVMQDNDSEGCQDLCCLNGGTGHGVVLHHQYFLYPFTFAPCPYTKNCPEDGSPEPKHVANCVLTDYICFLVIVQPDAQILFNVFIYLQFSTCFEHVMLIIRRNKLYQI